MRQCRGRCLLGCRIFLNSVQFLINGFSSGNSANILVDGLFQQIEFVLNFVDFLNHLHCEVHLFLFEGEEGLPGESFLLLAFAHEGLNDTHNLVLVFEHLFALGLVGC